MLLLWSVVFPVVIGVPLQSFRVNKCCSEDQALTTDYRCTSYKNYYSPRDANTDLPHWLLAEVAVESRHVSDFHVKIQYGRQTTCEGRQHLVFADDVDLFSLREDGGLNVYDEDYERNMTFPYSSFCFDRLLLEESKAVHVILLCPCNIVACIRKCCLSGSYLNETRHCVPDDTDTVRHAPFHDSSSKYFHLNGLPLCRNGGAYLSRSVSSPNNKQHQFRFLDDGRVEGSELRQPLPVEEYCWDATVDGNGSELQKLLYCKRKEISERRVLYGVMILVGAAFLLATLLVYAALPELRNGLHAKYLMAHTASFLVAYVFLGAGQLLPVAHYVTCTAVAFIIQFTFIAAFFWLNVMCIDIAWAFSGLRPPQGSAIERDHKKFILYSVYAWGTSGILSVITATVEFVPGLAVGSPLKPNFGHKACWFKESDATLAYFYGPMAFLLLANLILFLYTVARIISVRRDTAILSRAGSTSGSAIHQDRQRLVLYVKLFCLMGLTWITEIISWAVGGAYYYWYIPDFANLSRAVFIFVIFCCKRNVLKLLRSRVASCLPYKKIKDWKRGGSLSGPMSSLQLTASIKKSTGRPSQDT